METTVRFERPVYERIFAEARPLLQTRHNEIHTRVCYRFALRLLREEGGDADVVVPGVLLHDVGWSRVPEHLQLTAFGPRATNGELRDVHEREGAAMARGILTRLGYPEDKADLIAQIISRHDSRPDAETLEEQIVKDADKLWRFSREGLAIDAERFGEVPAHWLSRIEGRLESWFLTAAGKRLAREEASERRRELEIP